MLTLSRSFQSYTLALLSVAAVGVVVFAHEIGWREWPRLLVYFPLLVWAYSLRVPGPRGPSLTPSAVLTYVAMYVFNPPTAVLLCVAGRTIGDVYSRGWVPWRALFNGAQLALSVALGASVFRWLGGGPQRIGELSVFLALLAAPLVSQVANNLFVSIPLSQWKGTPFLSTWFNGVKYLFWQNLLSIPTAIALAFFYTKVHSALILLYLGLLPFQWSGLDLYVKRRRLYAQIVDGLVVATDANFPLGKGHARRVADIAVSVAREMHVSEPESESIEFAALLHDVGMIGKDDVLDRPVLTPEDTDSLRDHVRVGSEIAKELPNKEIAEMILCHHERYDGAGYPGGLRGEAIPLGARILALAEAVDSMASGSFPYTAAFPFTSVVSYVTSERGRSFDPDVVDAYLGTLEEGSSVETLASRRRVVHPPTSGELPAG